MIEGTGSDGEREKRREGIVMKKTDREREGERDRRRGIREETDGRGERNKGAGIETGKGKEEGGNKSIF